MPTEKEPLVWGQLNDHEINQKDEDTYLFIKYDNRWDNKDWFNSFRLMITLE